MTKISALSDIGTSVASNDTFVLVDVSDPTTPNKKIQQQNLFLIPDGSAGTPAVRFLNDTDVGLFRPTTNTLAFATGGSERLRVDSSGRVGIGTTSPSTGLEVATGSIFCSSGGLYLNELGGTSSVYLSYGGGNPILMNGANGAIRFGTNNAEKVRIDSSGRLLVGTSSDTTGGDTGAKVQIVDSGTPVLALSRDDTTIVSGNTIGQIRIFSNDDSGYQECARIAAQADGDFANNDKPTRLVFSTTADGASSPTERMRIVNDGNLLVYGNGNGVAAKSSQPAGTVFGLFVGAHSASSTTTGTNSFLVYTNGNVVNTNNSYGAISDIKLKENIVGASSQWDDLKDLRVVNYNFKEGQTHTQIGLIAQEVELVSPGLVSESPDRDEDGNDLGTVTKSVNYSVLYMKAVKALQEAIERIEVLEAKVNTLEGN